LLIFANARRMMVTSAEPPTIRSERERLRCHSGKGEGMKARRPACAASLGATSILALGLFVSAPNSASANIIYQYRSTGSEIDVAPFGGGTTGLVLRCSELPSDQMSATVTVRDSYVPGTALSPGDVLSVVYRDPGYDVDVRTVCSPDGTCIDEFVPVHYPYVFDFGEVDAFGVIPASPGEPGFLIVKLAHGEDISLSIAPKEGWFYTCCGLGVRSFILLLARPADFSV